MYKQNLLEPSKTWPKGAKWTLKSGVLGAKSVFWVLKNYELATKIERQSGAKCRFFLKRRQNERRGRLEIEAI